MTDNEIKEILEIYSKITWDVSGMVWHCSEGFTALWATEQYLWRLFAALPTNNKE